MKNHLLAYTVHMLTASGVVLAFWAVYLIMQGDAANAFRVLALAALVDSIDGTLARRVNVRRYTPHIDGDLMDNLVDYLTWVFLPLVWAWAFLDIHFLVCAAAMLSSMFGFAHTQAKTEDQFFRGFPSYWNLVVLYLFLLDAGAVTSSILVLILAAMVLTPVRLVYPSRTPALQKTTLLLSFPYAVLLGVMLYYFESTPSWLVYLSLYYLVYYTLISFYLVKSPALKRVLSSKNVLLHSAFNAIDLFLYELSEKKDLESNWPDRWINGAASSGSHTAFRAFLQHNWVAAAPDQLRSHPRSN